ncbi:MAG: peptidoglycan editing factor PgeF [Bacteroidota bacterium]
MDEIPIIRSRKFSEYPSIAFGFSTRIGGVSPEPLGLNLSFNVGDDRDRVAENRRRFLAVFNIPPDRLAIPKQSHSKTVKRVNHPGEYADCDALVTGEKGVYLVVSVADCIPLFMYDPIRKLVAAVHVGWRGSASGIVRETMRILREEFATAPEDLGVYLGPSARACCYEVREDVASKFPPQFLQPKSPGKLLLDLTGATKAQLIQNGVREDRIEKNGSCTICTPELFHSYRRDGQRSGRMMGVIGLAF